MTQSDRPREKVGSMTSSNESRYEQLAHSQAQTRRQFIGGCTMGLGSLFLSTLGLNSSNLARATEVAASRLPHLEKHIDDLCFIKSMHTDQFNDAPGQLLVQTGNARFGNASLGSWVTYGLGSENQNLPGFIVLLSGARLPDGGKQLWGSGFLP